MPTFQTPGTYLEETPFLSHSIEGQGTTTSAFIGLTAWGAIEERPPLLTSFSEFERFYGPAIDIHLGEETKSNYLAHAARAFFDNGGQRLRIVRIAGAGVRPASWNDPGGLIRFTTSTPGSSGVSLSFTVERAPLNKAQALLLPVGTLTEILGETCVLDSENRMSKLTSLADDVCIICVTLKIIIEAPGLPKETHEQLAFDPRHPRAVQVILGAQGLISSSRIYCEIDPTLDPVALHDILEATPPVTLADGSDGDVPTQADWNAGMERVEDLVDVSIIAAPGSSALPGDIPDMVAKALIALTEKTASYRFAVIDPPPMLDIGAVQQVRQSLDTKNAALYYPWIVVADPARSAAELTLPPSGFLCGIYGRSDIQRGVAKAPANESVVGALGLAMNLDSALQGLLNSKDINCIRQLPGRGIRVWGARTLSSDPEWTYIAQRRYFLYLKESIDRGIAWAVFEPNGDMLWAALIRAIEDFLTSEWKTGALQGVKAKEAFFVRCDRSTMTQNDLDNGHVIISIGIAPMKPAEFVIFRIYVTIGATGK